MQSSILMAQNPYQPPPLESFQENRRQSPAAALPSDEDGLTPQQRVDVLLGDAVLFSITWVLGLGSACSIHLARQAHRMIRQTDPPLWGMPWVWWCYGVGGLGLVGAAALLLWLVTLTTPVQRLLSG